MAELNELWVDRDSLRKTRIVRREMPDLDDGCVRVAIDMFAVTANNVSYANAGDSIGYWNFYPAEDGWGRVPVWGFGDVVQSRCADISVGERIRGFLPMASHVDLRPGEVSAGQFTDVAGHRQSLPGVYNTYERTSGEPEQMKGMEVERCLYFPLFVTSFFLYDYLVDNDFFKAGQILIGSASSKTGYGLAHLLHEDANVSQRVVGLTSAGNTGFVEGLGCYDQVVAYGNEAELDSSLPAAYVDMSGDTSLLVRLHTLFGDGMKESCLVGLTHWEAGKVDDLLNGPGDLPGAQPHFFFAPAQIEKRNAEWGGNIAITRAAEASARISATLPLEVTWTRGIEDLKTLWIDLLDNKVAPSTGQMVSLAV